MEAREYSRREEEVEHEFAKFKAQGKKSTPKNFYCAKKKKKKNLKFKENSIFSMAAKSSDLAKETFFKGCHKNIVKNLILRKRKEVGGKRRRNKVKNQLLELVMRENFGPLEERREK